MIKNKIKKALVLGMILAMTITTLVNAETLPYKDVDGTKCINMMEFVKLKGGEIYEASHEWYGKGYNFVIDGKMITIYEEGPYIFIDGRMTTLKHEIISADGLEYYYPVMENPAKDGEDFLVPLFFLESEFNLEGTEEGLEVKVEEDKEEEDKEEEDKGEGNKEEEDKEDNEEGNKPSKPEPPKPSKPEPPTKPQPPKPEEPKPQPPTKPQPPKPEPPKPEPPKPQPTGMDFLEFSSKLLDMGFEEKGAYLAKDGELLGVGRADSNGAYFVIEVNTPEFSSVIKNCFNMLLPTQGGRLYQIITSPFESQTLIMDNRSVEIVNYGTAVAVNIRNL